MWMGGPAPNFGRPPHAQLPRRRPEWQEVSHSGQHLPCHLAARSPHFWSQWAGRQPPQSWGLILHTHTLTHKHTHTQVPHMHTHIVAHSHTHTHHFTLTHMHSQHLTYSHTYTLTHTHSHHLTQHKHSHSQKWTQAHTHHEHAVTPPTHTHTGVHCHTGGATRALRPGLDVLVPVLPVPTPGPASKEQITGRRLRSSLTSSRQHSWGRNGVAGTVRFVLPSEKSGFSSGGGVF